MNDELLKLTRENNDMLKQIIVYINSINSQSSIANDDIKNFVINVIANIISNNGYCK